MSSLFGSLDTTKLDRDDVVDPGAATESGKAADAKRTQEELDRILGVASNAKELAESKADKLSSRQLAAVNSGIDAGKVARIAQNESAISAEVSRATNEEARLRALISAVKTFEVVVADSLPSPSEQYGKKLYLVPSTNPETRNVKDEFICVKIADAWGWEQVGSTAVTIEFDDEPTEGSQKAARSGGVFSWVKSLLPSWLTNDYAEPATVESVAAKADKTDLEGFATEAELLAFYYPDGSVTSMSQITASGIGYAVGNDGGAYVVKGEGLSGHVVLPWKVTIEGNEYRVTAIGVNAFNGSKYDIRITDLTAPTTIKSIGDSAFGDCHSLTSVNLPSATSLGVSAFVACHSLTSVNIPSATSIGEGAFVACSSLTSISLPSATSLGDSAFRECSSLTSVNLPSATSIGAYAFRECVSLTTIDFGPSPKSAVPSLGSFAFEEVPTSCKFIIPIDMYDEWIAASGWGNLYIQGYKFDGYASTAQLANKVGSFASVGGATATVDNGVAKLSDFFTESNSLLNGRLAYSRNATGLKDRAFNTLSFDGTEFNLSTALEEVTPTASGQPRDLLIVATATAATTIGYTAGTIKGDKPTIDGSGTWLITLTEYASGVWYCRQIKMEDAA